MVAKRLVAVTNIKHDGIFISANSTLDHTLFTKEQLTQLYDNGAIRLEVDPEIIPEESSVAVASVTTVATIKAADLPNTVRVTVAEKPTVESTVKSEDTNGKSINK